MIKNQKGFSASIVILVVVIIGLLGFIVWRVLSVSPTDTSTQQTPSASNESTAPTQDQEKSRTVASWTEFNEPTVGLKLHYPPAWGKPKFQKMGNASDAMNPLFYKLTFDNQVVITVTPKGSLKESSTTFSTLKDSVKTPPGSRYVFVDKTNIVGTIVPSRGNQTAEIYASRSISLPKIDASDIVLTDSREYSASCTHEAYKSCYSADELNAFQWLLEDAQTAN